MTLSIRRVYGKIPVQQAPEWWKEPCTNIECSLHQLAPYIGKTKSSIIGDLVERYSKLGDLIVDPFAGAGTVPLEAVIRGRHAFAADISPYARILSQAKLSPPRTLQAALTRAQRALSEAETLPQLSRQSVPPWVRKFFHPKTLDEALRFATIARRPGNEFLMACFLGILHHQRPGFLSYPSSHLVPYLRDKKYPRAEFPEMYTYRELKPRLLSKVQRAYRRLHNSRRMRAAFYQGSIEDFKLPKRFDAVITSPPYMNALDYSRDNRLRLWFIDPDLEEPVENDITQRRQAFISGISSLATQLETGLRSRGYCVFIVGEEIHRSFSAHPSEVVVTIIKQQSPSLQLHEVFADTIPDVRRTRREYRGVKTEHFLVFQRN
jgi:hypothetical protein